MTRRLLIVLVAATVLEWVAFRYVHRDLFWFDMPAAASAPVTTTRETAEATLSRARLSRRHTEALIRSTDRDGLHDIRVEALARLVQDHPDDPDVWLRYAEALRQQNRLDEAARAFARVAGAR
jgi:cytochrome c-type biogenesis protein CcmH/NrfG